MSTLRPELTPMPHRIASLPIDERGYPIPFFVDYVDGKPEFRAMDRAKWQQSAFEDRCWVCGQKRGSFKSFVLGPMCTISRSTAEPPCHLDCAEWSAINCPFLARPHMVRRDHDALAQQLKGNAPGIMIDRNPGVTAVWTTKTFTIWRAPNGPMITVGPPEAVRWFAGGRVATRAEVVASIDSGLPFLIEQQQQQDATEGRHGMKALLLAVENAKQHLPAVFA